MSLISPIINREKSMRVIDLITWAETYFSGKGFDHPRAEIEWFLQELLNCNRMDIYLKSEEVLSLSDRIVVMFDGNIVGEKINKDVTDRELGLLMAGVA